MNKKKHYLIYQITNNINQKFYIGKHETYKIDDDYFGSGKYLQNAIEKHGIENFTKTILFELQNREEMNLLEKTVVTPEFCAREDTYNINVGGDGGWNYVNHELHLNGNKMFVKNMSKADFSKRGLKAAQSYANHREHFTEDQQQQYKAMKRRIALRGFSQAFKNKHHSNEAKQKIGRAASIHQRGSLNSQYGKKWIYNNELQVSFPVDEYWFYEYLSQGYCKCRKYFTKK